MAILARVPDSIASMRCVIGAPTSTFTPGTFFILSRISASTSSFERLSKTNGASTSETFTPNACSSNSARPVLRPTVWISGIVSNASSTIRPTLSDSSNEIPGNVLTLTVNDPSLKGGKKLRPSVENITIAPTIATPVIDNTTFLLRSVNARILV